jgi:hypothetical protein
MCTFKNERKMNIFGTDKAITTPISTIAKSFCIQGPMLGDDGHWLVSKGQQFRPLWQTARCAAPAQYPSYRTKRCVAHYFSQNR